MPKIYTQENFVFFASFFLPPVFFASFFLPPIQNLTINQIFSTSLHFTHPIFIQCSLQVPKISLQIFNQYIPCKINKFKNQLTDDVEHTVIKLQIRNQNPEMKLPNQKSNKNSIQVEFYPSLSSNILTPFPSMIYFENSRTAK